MEQGTREKEQLVEGRALELDLIRPVLARSGGSLGTRGRLAEGRERRRRGAGMMPSGLWEGMWWGEEWEASSLAPSLGPLLPTSTPPPRLPRS